MLLRIAILLVAAGTTLAVITGSFPGWENLTKYMPDIVVIECKPATNSPRHWLDGLVQSDGEVISVLKGGMKPGPMKLASWHQPWEGHFYLLFGNCQSNYVPQTIIAVQSFEVIPLQSKFRTNDFTGKKLDVKIQMLLQYRYEDPVHMTVVPFKTSGDIKLQSDPTCFPSALTSAPPVTTLPAHE